MSNEELLKKAAETINRLGAAAQDCKSCERLSQCNAYKDGDIFHNGDEGYSEDEIKEIMAFVDEIADLVDDLSWKLDPQNDF